MATLRNKNGDGYRGEEGLIKIETEWGVNERECLFPGCITCRLSFLSDAATLVIKQFQGLQNENNTPNFLECF